ncbi:MAG: hypothetical protein ACRYFS_06610 [Janthinobacterium lividum]
MKSLRSNSSRLFLAAGALAAFAALPQSASAQINYGNMRSGAVTAQGQSAAAQPPVQMRPGPIVRGAAPVYRSAPVANSGTQYGGTPVYNRRPVYNQPPVYSQSPVYNNGSGYGYGGGSYYGNGSYGNGEYGYGGGVNLPIITPPSGAYYPTFGGGYGRQSSPPIGPANGYFTHPIPPVGPANGFFSGQAPITGGGPALLGGYYYGNYCNVGSPYNTYPSVYSDYSGFPQYIYNPDVTVYDNSYNPVYMTPYLPFYTPVYQATYNQNNYYVATQGRVDDLQAGGERAKEALQHAYPANSFQAAFADIAQAWTGSDISMVRSHLRDSDTRISVFLNGKYSYSIASSDYSQMTRDALDRLHTVSFTFTRLRKAKNGDVTAYGTHVYQVADSSGGADTGTVPFDQSGTDNSAPYDQTNDPALGTQKTIYVSYTLRRYAGEWDIVTIDSASHDLSKTAE